MSAMSVFAKLGGDLVQPDILIPATIPLELSGEVVRSRICAFTDEEGREWALRPDLTLPVAIMEVAARADRLTGPATRFYDGPVFRLPASKDEPAEFRQMGFEIFGASSKVSTDVDLYTAICEACTAEGVDRGYTQLGDLAVFPAFVDGLGLSRDIADGLKRAFRQEGGVRAFIRADRTGAAANLAQRMSGMSRAEVEAFVEDIFALTGIRPIGERSSMEIVERLADRAQSNIGPELGPDVQKLVEQVLGVDVPAQQAAEHLSTLAKTFGIQTADTAIENLAVRLDGLSGDACRSFIDGARFQTRFGRRFTYYDGFVFEISAGDRPDQKLSPFATGGRYDGLLADLSNGAIDTTALGGVIMPYRFTTGQEAGS